MENKRMKDGKMRREEEGVKGGGGRGLRNEEKQM